MIKRITSLTTMLLLLVSVTVPTRNPAFAKSNPPSLQEQAKDKVRRAIEDARKKATYDPLGRIIAASIELPGLGKFKFEYKYDRQKRLQYILDEDGGRTQYKYGKVGELETITLPDGTRMYELDENGKGVFFQHGIGRNSGGLRFSKSAMVQGGDACRAAVAAAAVAAAAAAASCASGDIAGCIFNTAAAAAAAYAAYVACKENAFEIQDGPVG